ncbi:FkbM family methyltransferase [Candidatus Pelagibacter sp.]|uniref:FkbM family methyltransferase n=1 Tax=Candidatus Pelagibacter sp. TaxID=2024849 RepID=UPI003F861964
MKTLINSLFKIFGLKIVKLDYLLYVQRLLKKYNYIRYLDVSEKNRFKEIGNIFYESNSENSQDIMVLDQLNFKKNGFFVEFGAGNGEKFSNTFLLEKKFNWEGILAEPCKSFHKEICSKRNCVIDKRAVSDKTGVEVNFVEFENKHFSKINFKPIKNKINYTVLTISLMDLLNEYNCPNEFDYLSIDTEGNEFEILKNLDFTIYKPSIISIEHNHDSKIKESIFDLLNEHGYIKIFKEISDQDDWYKLKNL